MACGVLPSVDKQICLFERWLLAHLDTICDRDHRQLIQRFATWEVLPRLRARAGNKPITPASRYFAGDQIKQATTFLCWLAHHHHSLRTCDQAESPRRVRRLHQLRKRWGLGHGKIEISAGAAGACGPDGRRGTSEL
jgi:hypothetical protein